MTINLEFSKMHGLGNDYVVINEYQSEIIPEDKKSAVARNLCRRGFSIGADGVIFVASSSLKEADIKFRIFNADGSEAEMCGNGIRCFAKFVYENSIVSNRIMKVETLGGIKEVEICLKDGKADNIQVDMGISNFKTSKVPMNSKLEEFINKELLVKDKPIKMTVLNVGNPHAIIFHSSLDDIDLEKIGPDIENHDAFPERINVHFVNILNNNEIEMITWERGSGITLACGTGATSSVLAGYKQNLLNEKVLVHLPGGELYITVYQKNGELGAFIKGDAVLVFNGKIKLNIDT